MKNHLITTSIGVVGLVASTVLAGILLSNILEYTNEVKPQSKTIMLNFPSTSKLVTNTSTIFYFDAQVNFSGYLGIGLLVYLNSTFNCSVTLKEPNGKFVANVSYHGQNPIVFNGQHTTSYYANGSVFSESYLGMEVVRFDWISGSWNPADGLQIYSNPVIDFDSAILMILKVRT